MSWSDHLLREDLGGTTLREIQNSRQHNHALPMGCPHCEGHQMEIESQWLYPPEVSLLISDPFLMYREPQNLQGYRTNYLKK